MPFVFQIRPVSIETGFDLSCEGILEETSHHERFIDAIIRAAQLGRDMDAEIQLFDSNGRPVETLQLPTPPTNHSQLQTTCV